MCVHDNAFGFAECNAEDDAGGLAATAVELNKFRHRLWDLAGMAFGDSPATVADGLGFVAEEAGRTNQVFEISGAGEISGGPVFGEEGRGDFVDAFIGALGAEDGGDEELERIGVVQGAFGIGIGAAQTGENFAGKFPLGSVHGAQYSIAKNAD